MDFYWFSISITEGQTFSEITIILHFCCRKINS